MGVWVWGRVHVGRVFFFFQEKTAYEIQDGLGGSEVCIRDRGLAVVAASRRWARAAAGAGAKAGACLLYTSDAAEERSRVDLGGRGIIKKKKHKTTTLLGPPT